MAFLRQSVYVLICLFTLLAHAEPQKISLPKTIGQRAVSFEPSGAIYLSDLGKFLIVSDDTNDDKTALLFLMDKNGKIDQDLVPLTGLKKLTDMESISQLGDEVFILPSLGLNKKGKSKDERNLFVRAKRKGLNLSVSQAIDLRSILLKALHESPLAPIKDMRNRLDDELDVESHFIKEGSLYVGLKNPQPKPGQALILNLGSVERLFRKKSLPSSQVQIAYLLDFQSKSPAIDLLSEVFVNADGMWLSTTTEINSSSRLWKLDSVTGKPQQIKAFAQERLEALALEPEGKRLLLLFDQGKKEALFDYHFLKLATQSANDWINFWTNSLVESI